MRNRIRVTSAFGRYVAVGAALVIGLILLVVFFCCPPPEREIPETRETFFTVFSLKNILQTLEGSCRKGLIVSEETIKERVAEFEQKGYADGWGNVFRIEIKDGKTIVVVSGGEDGEFGTSDDICAVGVLHDQDSSLSIRQNTRELWGIVSFYD